MQGISQACNNDDVMLRAYSLQVETIDSGNDYSSYTSQLNITYSTSVIGSTVVCAYDNGTQIIHIGSEIITTNIKCMNNRKRYDNTSYVYACMLHGYNTWYTLKLILLV